MATQLTVTPNGQCRDGRKKFIVDGLSVLATDDEIRAAVTAEFGVKNCSVKRTPGVSTVSVEVAPLKKDETPNFIESIEVRMGNLVRALDARALA